MMIKHHLSEKLLLAYSSGNLPEAFNLVVATHISMCDECRIAACAHDAVGGAVLESSDCVEMEPNAFAKTLKLISDQDEPMLNDINIRRSGKSRFPKPLQDYVGGDLNDVRWRSIGMGVKQSILKTSKEATVRLLRIPAGSAVPDHGHQGTELTLVLQGAFVDETDRFGPGDVEVANEDLNHMPIAELGEDCICLAATDAPLRFNSLIPRIAQPFFRI